MHIPDGFLSGSVLAGSAALSVAGLSLALNRIKKNFENKLIPTMGVLAAFIFAAQMFNFPVAAGTSGHLLGGVLAAVILGPMAASVILMVVLIVQSLLFQDGGLLALGANVFNMAIVGTWTGWAIFKIISRISKARIFYLSGVFVGACASVVAASAMCSLELAMSGVIPLKVGLPTMAAVHTLIGIGEGIITLSVISFVQKVKPELLK